VSKPVKHVAGGSRLLTWAIWQALSLAEVRLGQIPMNRGLRAVSAWQPMPGAQRIELHRNFASFKAGCGARRADAVAVQEQHDLPNDPLLCQPATMPHASGRFPVSSCRRSGSC